MSFLGGLFSSSRALRVADGGVAPLPEPERAHHANQRVARAWTVAASGADAASTHQLTKLALETPGLTVVRVRAASDLDPLTAARVVATSDAARHLERLEVAVKHKHELRVEFKNPHGASNTASDALGALVVEIELAHASRVVEIRASGGGDVVVVDDGGRAVLARRDDADVSLVALDPHSRLFALADGGLAVQSLRLGAVSGGSVFVTSAGALVTRDHVACMVLGDGRVAVHAPSVETRELMVAVVGARGHAQLLAHGNDGVVAAKAETAVVGGGAVLVQAPPARERDVLFTSCERLKVDISGGSCVDVAALASREVHVSAKGGARAVVQAREWLSMTCDARATVECVGGLPPRVDPAPQHVPAEMLHAVAHESRVWTASEPVPDAPTPQMLFEAPRVMAVKKAGFRETLRPLWAAMQSHVDFNAVPYTTIASSARSGNGSAAAATPAATPAWVSVMSDVAGAPGKSLD